MRIDGVSLSRPERYPAEKSAGLRWSARANLEWPVEVVTNDTRMDAVTLNVGPQGAYVRCPSPLGLDEVFELRLRIPGAGREIRASARVVWSKKYGRDDPISPHGMGVQFCDIGHDDRAIISKAVLDSLRGGESVPAA